jgi:hypothetical protein
MSSGASNPEGDCMHSEMKSKIFGNAQKYDKIQNESLYLSRAGLYWSHLRNTATIASPCLFASR